MNTTSKRKEREGVAMNVKRAGKGMGISRLSSFVSTLVVSFLMLLTTACDYQGPWSYYPEETEVYQGVYTYGYIIAGESPYVCFSKVYDLTETAAENFTFYDSAKVTVTGKFGLGTSKKISENMELPLQSLISKGKPNCFGVSEDYYGLKGESYTLNAYFEWDSLGHKAATEFVAIAKIPTKVHAKGVIPPSVTGNAKYESNKYEYMSYEFLGFPNDILTYKIPMEYDESVRGILMTMIYDYENGGESMNTTLNNMMSSFMKPDSMGYTGISTKEPTESTASMGFTSRMVVGGTSTLDTMEYPGMTIPIGKSKVYFFATDQAFVDYENTVLEALEDARIVPKTNVENGMGVFSGMLKDSLLLEISAEEYVSYEHMRVSDCFQEDKMMGTKPFSTKWCRLNQRNICVDEQQSGFLRLYFMEEECFAMVERIMIEYELESESWGRWDVFVDSVSKKDDVWWGGASRRDKIVGKKAAINGKALQIYCIESNFKNNQVANCDKLRRQCQETLEKNDCKESIWEWCSDRDWNITDYPQCGTAMTSRYYLEKLNSSILKTVVDSWCNKNPKDAQCKR